MNNLQKLRVNMAHELLQALIGSQQEFRIVLWNNDNWDKPLPKDIIEKFPEQLVMDIKEESLQDSFVENNEVILSTGFVGEQYSKVVKPEEIVGLFDLTGNPMMINNFRMLITSDAPTKAGKINLEKIFNEVSKEVDDTQYDNIIKSLNAFQVNNKELFS